MTVVQEVRDAIDLMTELIEKTRTITDAARDGQEFMKRHHAGAQHDLGMLLEQVRKTLNGLVQVSRVLTHFQFTVAGHGSAFEPSRFNNYMIASKSELQDLRERMEDLRANCKKVGEHARALDERASAGWCGWSILLGSRKKERADQEVANMLHLVYGDDQHIIQYIHRMMRAVEISLREVTVALGSRSGANPENVPAAAAVLEDYASNFESVERDCFALVGELRARIDDLE